MRPRWTVLVTGAAVALALGATTACGGDAPSDFPPPPSGFPGSSPGTSPGSTRAATATTRLVCPPSDTRPDTGAAATPDGGAPDDTSPSPSIESACSSDTLPDRPGTSTSAGRAPRLEALTAYLTAKYADTPWRSQLADYDLSTAEDQFELTIRVRGAMPAGQAVEACKAVAGWSTSAFADGTITITDPDGHAIAATPSARNRPCEAS